MDRSVGVTIGAHLPCIDRLLQGTLGTELLLQNYYNNVTVMYSDIMSIYMQTLLNQLKMTFLELGGGGPT